jgi:hypothetical protein
MNRPLEKVHGISDVRQSRGGVKQMRPWNVQEGRPMDMDARRNRWYIAVHVQSWFRTVHGVG